jgi:hypothetical protein
MVKNKNLYLSLISILITLGIILSLAFYESHRLKTTFSRFKDALTVLYDKTERGSVTYEDGQAVKDFWEFQKNTLHIWIPHTAILEVDYQLYEAVGCIYVRDYKSALPKIEILLGMCENIPQSYRFSIENVL